MLETMRDLALLELNRRCGTRGASLRSLRREHGDVLAPLLVESGEGIPRAYLLQPVAHAPGTVRLWVEELDQDKRRRLPFNQGSGASSPAVGPVFKRTSKPRKTPPYGPSAGVQETTRKAFEGLAGSNAPWAAYFQQVCATLFHAHTLRFADRDHPVGGDADDPHVLAAALRLIPEAKGTVFLAVVDADGRWPGDRADYKAYLVEALPDVKYTTGDASPREDGHCPLCGEQPVRLYPNAMRGAGLNLGNMDRVGAFPGLDVREAWKGYGLCRDCADALYVFKFHCSRLFLGSVVGERALVLPALLGIEDQRQAFLRDWHDYVGKLGEGKLGSREADLLEFFVDQDDAYVVVQVLWASFGQRLDDVRGALTDILPSRLQALSQLNAQARDWSHVLAPRFPHEDARFDLGLSGLYPLLHQPGGRKVRDANQSPQLFALKRQIAEALYHGRPLGEAGRPLWEAVLETARAYLDEAMASGSTYGLLREGVSTKKRQQTRFWTLAGWVRYLAQFLHYLDITGVLPMEHDAKGFRPRMAALAPFFQPGSGLDSDAKAFAFLLGILYGKVLEVQGAKGLNVAANALSWLRRLNLSGRDLPALYCKVREKLMTYGTEASAPVRALEQDIARLGALLGDDIALDTVPTCYFLLLGQSVMVDVLPGHTKDDGDHDA